MPRFRFLTILATFFTSFFLLTQTALASTNCDKYGVFTNLPNLDYDPSRSSIPVKITGDLDPNSKYEINANYHIFFIHQKLGPQQPFNGTLNFSITNGVEGAANKDTTVTVELIVDNDYLCSFDDFIIYKASSDKSTCSLTLWQNGKENLRCYDDNSPISVSSNNIEANSTPFSGAIEVCNSGPQGHTNPATVTNGILPPTLLGQLDLGLNTVYLHKNWSTITLCQKRITIKDYCDPKDQEPNSGGVMDDYNFDLCTMIPADPDREQCIRCLSGDGIWTGLGCIRYNPEGLVQDLLTLALAVGGLLALILLIFGAFKISVSAGDPKQMQEAKETFTSAIVGLLIIIFAITMLQLIGVDILQIPGL